MRKLIIGMFSLLALGCLSLSFVPAPATLSAEERFVQLAILNGIEDQDQLDQAAELKAKIDALKAQFDKLNQRADKLQDGKDGKLGLPRDQDRKFKTGAMRTPVPKIVEALRTGRAGIFTARGPTPASVTMVPKTLSMLGNDQNGDCVTAESCFSMEAYSVYVGLPQIVITDATAVAWARAHGVLNGADLLSVMQAMGTDGIKDSTGKLYKAGPPSTVDYGNEATLQAAIAIGPVSIAIAANALPSGAGNQSGWYVFGSRNDHNTDHNIDICGYGDPKILFTALGTPVPAGAPSMVYLAYTWSTIGVVDHPWIMGTVDESWVRNPTVVGLSPQPSQIVVSLIGVSGSVGQPMQVMPLATGGTGQYTWSVNWGDGSQSTDQNAAHTYAQVGTFTVTATATDSAGVKGSGSASATIGTGPQPPQPPLPGAPTITLSGTNGDDGTYLLVQQQIANMRLVDLLSGQNPSPASLRALAEIRAILDAMKVKQK